MIKFLVLALFFTVGCGTAKIATDESIDSEASLEVTAKDNNVVIDIKDLHLRENARDSFKASIRCENSFDPILSIELTEKQIERGAFRVPRPTGKNCEIQIEKWVKAPFEVITKGWGSFNLEEKGKVVLWGPAQNTITAVLPKEVEGNSMLSWGFICQKKCRGNRENFWVTGKEGRSPVVFKNELIINEGAIYKVVLRAWGKGWWESTFVAPKTGKRVRISGFRPKATKEVNVTIPGIEKAGISGSISVHYKFDDYVWSDGFTRFLSSTEPMKFKLHFPALGKDPEVSVGIWPDDPGACEIEYYKGIAPVTGSEVSLNLEQKQTTGSCGKF